MRLFLNQTALWVAGGVAGWCVARWDANDSPVPLAVALACFAVILLTRPPR